jgi:hypothetical protein
VRRTTVDKVDRFLVHVSYAAEGGA